MSTSSHPPSAVDNAPVRPRPIRLPSFRTFETQLNQPVDNSLQLAPMQRIGYPLPPRPVAHQLYPDYHWKEYHPEKCTCSSVIGRQHVHTTLPIPTVADSRRRPPTVHRSTSQHPPSPPHLPLSPSSQCPSPPSLHSSTPPRHSSSPSSSRRTQATATQRPRWRAEERLELFKAVSHDKELEDMSTFNWDTISEQVGRSRKSCKDQWRREIYRMMLEVFEHQMASGRNLGFIPHEHEQETTEDDSEQESRSMDCESD